MSRVCCKNITGDALLALKGAGVNDEKAQRNSEFFRKHFERLRSGSSYHPLPGIYPDPPKEEKKYAAMMISALISDGSKGSRKILESAEANAQEQETKEFFAECLKKAAKSKTWEIVANGTAIAVASTVCGVIVGIDILNSLRLLASGSVAGAIIGGIFALATAAVGILGIFLTTKIKTGIPEIEELERLKKGENLQSEECSQYSC